jgi:hypothetical protein
VERTGSHSIRFSGRDILEVSRFLEFMGDDSAELTPQAVVAFLNGRPGVLLREHVVARQPSAI